MAQGDGSQTCDVWMRVFLLYALEARHLSPQVLDLGLAPPARGSLP
jgi:hypothetical protein